MYRMEPDVTTPIIVDTFSQPYVLVPLHLICHMEYEKKKKKLFRLSDAVFLNQELQRANQTNIPMYDISYLMIRWCV